MFSWGSKAVFKMKERLKFFDAFAGIGGFHLGLSKLGFKCAFACEIDKHARRTYEHNFRSLCPNLFEGGCFANDIRELASENIPSFDLLTAGWPCQPFSQAGKRRGFSESRGSLFFEIEKIIEAKRPSAYLLENVRYLESHDGGRTFRLIQDILTQKLGYSMFTSVFKASDFGLPQHRPRLYMVGFRDKGINFVFPKPLGKLVYTMSDVFRGDCQKEVGYTLRVGGRGSPIGDRRNWDSYLVNGCVKQIGPKEGLMMQGFPEWFEFPEDVSTSSRMRQLGNSVAIPTIEAIGKRICHALCGV
jgi:DNA (cytosine-5)-methyltransferase 1